MKVHPVSRETVSRSATRSSKLPAVIFEVIVVIRRAEIQADSVMCVL